MLIEAVTSSLSPTDASTSNSTSSNKLPLSWLSIAVMRLPDERASSRAVIVVSRYKSALASASSVPVMTAMASKLIVVGVASSRRRRESTATATMFSMRSTFSSVASVARLKASCMAGLSLNEVGVVP